MNICSLLHRLTLSLVVASAVAGCSELSGRAGGDDAAPNAFGSRSSRDTSPDLQACHRGWGEHRPTTGKFTFEFDIAPGGTLRGVHPVKPADGSAEVAQCIFDAYRTFDFSKSRSYEVTLEYGRPADAGTATSPLDSVRAEMLALQMRKWAAAHADGGSRDGGRTFEEPPPGFPAALVDSSDRVRGCWEEALQRKRLRDVQLSMRIVVSSDGKITTADVTDGTYREAQLEGCLSRVVKSLELPAVPGGGSADFTQRFTFSAGGGH